MCVKNIFYSFLYHFLNSREGLLRFNTFVQLSKFNMKIDFVSNLIKDWKLHSVLTRKHIQKDRLELRLHESAKSPEDNPFFSQIELFKMDSDVILFKWHGRGRISTKVASFSILNRVQQTNHSVLDRI